MKSAGAFLIDLDGTLIRGAQTMAGSAALLRRLEGRYAIVSNNSTDTASALAERLQATGLPVTEQQLVLAGEQTIRFLASCHAGRRILLIASQAMHRMAADCGLTLVDRNTDIVVLMRDPAFDYAKLSVAVNELVAGATLIVSNPDLSHPGIEGQLVVETGSLMRALTACAGVAPAQIIGKPEPHLFVEAMQRLAVAPDDTIVIGDNPETDACGAARLGMRCLLVGPGVGTDASSPAALLAGQQSAPDI